MTRFPDPVLAPSPIHDLHLLHKMMLRLSAGIIMALAAIFTTAWRLSGEICDWGCVSYFFVNVCRIGYAHFRSGKERRQGPRRTILKCGRFKGCRGRLSPGFWAANGLGAWCHVDRPVVNGATAQNMNIGVIGLHLGAGVGWEKAALNLAMKRL